ncbi:SAM-dependent methyltransferase [Aeromicrobium sp. A1-2]|uniref:SAM-dependent methyltransferase n=1 Tax=Aeromicrobium sp. A1-2 TaxID=2107713 RepID=UPI0013C2C106|nr:SAM-dependent methyltransferase [Aeromicrobium sp. A1-2]
MTKRPLPWREAWDLALYADDGFFRTSRPAEHFRTSAHLGGFAAAVAELIARTRARTVVDLGAGGGELLTALLPLVGADVRLIGVEVADRPETLPSSISWLPSLPDRIEGLLIANEWLDNIPCDVVEMAQDGRVRHVLVDPDTGAETFGGECDSEWLRTWWPLSEPGERAEIGATRDAAWADAVARVDGTAVAIDYGHRRADRPPFGTLRSYAAGREVDVVPDGSRDVTAHVAVDAVAHAAGATLHRQRDVLAGLGVDAGRPPLDLARTDPSAYLRRLAAAGEAGELLASGGLGDFWWLVTGPLGRGTLSP